MRGSQCLGMHTTSTPVQLLSERHSRSSEPVNVKPASQGTVLICDLVTSTQDCAIMWSVKRLFTRLSCEECICSALFGNLRNFEIALRKLAVAKLRANFETAYAISKLRNKNFCAN